MTNFRAFCPMRRLAAAAAVLVLAIVLFGCAGNESFFSGNYTPTPPTVLTAGAIALQSPDLPFRQYDSVMIGAISNQWFNAVKTLSPAPPAGTVTLAFQLNLNGTINDLQVVQSTMAEPYIDVCKQAVQAATPFESWPDQMRQACPDGYRDIHYRFDFK